MRILFLAFFVLIVLIFASCNISNNFGEIDRKSVVGRHNVTTTLTNPRSPAQVGNGEFAFGVDITGLQTFVPFNTMSHWGWHSDPLPEGGEVDNYKGQVIQTHGRPVLYPMADKNHPKLSRWLAGNPHRINLGRLSFSIKNTDGSFVKEEELQNTRQEVDLWTGIIKSSFEIDGVPVEVITSCHQDEDIIGVNVKSGLLGQGRLTVKLEFPYASAKNSYHNNYVGIWGKPDRHQTIVRKAGKRVNISRVIDKTRYYAVLAWDTECDFQETPGNPHLLELLPKENTLDFVCAYSSSGSVFNRNLPSAMECVGSSKESWAEYWGTGAAIDLSNSSDHRWEELERRVVLSQYLMRVNEAGSLPPQESGLVNNGWYGRFHFEMIWWHGVHYALWGRWPLFEKCLHVYSNFLKKSKERAKSQGYKGARWPKCTGPDGREWPHPIHAMLIWQQPNPIYFAEMDYRLHPTNETLEKWQEVVFETAEFMADFAFFEQENDRYVLGPPIYIVSENTKPQDTFNPAFKLAYWRFGLGVAQAWRERLGLERDKKWDNVLNKLLPLPEEGGVYVTHEKIDSMWVNFTFEHPALIGVYGMLPGNGVDMEVFGKTFDKVMDRWDFEKVWGWDFPMLAMAAARTNHPREAINFLLTNSSAFQFDEHGLSTGGPFPYFPSNGGLLTAIAMMAGGWDGDSGIDAPGFPKNGKWVVLYEGFNKMP